MRRSTAFVSSIIFLFLFASSVFADPSIRALTPQSVQSVQEQIKRDDFEIRLAHDHFDPLKTIPTPPSGVANIQTYGAGGVGYYIVQFDAPIEASWKKALEDIGVKIFDYIPDFAFIVKIDTSKEAAVRQVPHVRWLGIFQPSYKLSQHALDKTFTERTIPPFATPPVRLHISLFPGEELSSIETMVSGTGATILDTVTTEWGTTMKIEIPAEKIPELSYITGIKWIEPEPEWKLHNNVSTDVMNVRTPRDTYGLNGAGQTVGIADSGLDTANIATLHPDFSDGAGGTRVTTIIDLVGDGAQDYDGHGTHVAGSVLGNGLMSGSNPSINFFPSTCGAGIAPKANLVFQATASNISPYSLIGIPTDLNTLFSQSQTAGANLHTNSWGSNAQGMYTTNSQNVDQYMWNHKDFLILYSAGNDGVDLNRDGVIDLYGLGSPATAKNCLTVGASEGYRPSGAGYDFSWGTGSWLAKYYVAPIVSDHVSNNPGGMAAFSSRGPTLDGRYKPDIVAPGTNILSTRSSLASGTGWGAYNANYMWNGGTSMATPLTAGTAALMREYLMSFTPSAALIKAALINSATDIYPGQYGFGATQEIPTTAPNNVEGWGRVNLGNGVYPVPPFNILYADNQTGLSTGGNAPNYINVTDSNKPLKVNLVWTDYPGSPVSQGGLVNDLDLTVTDPSSMIHYPDNAVHKATVGTLKYDSDSNSPSTNTTYNYAIRFTPSSYPAKVESTTFLYYNPANSAENVYVNVYAADGLGGLPGTMLFSTILKYVPTGWHTIGITGVTINSGDFYIYVASSTQGIYVDEDLNPTGRSYYWNYNVTPAAWAVSAARTPYIRANVRGNDYSTSYDRTNNVEGITINNPVTGTYSINVNGYNVPYGPQPYALVVSGDINNTASITITTAPAGKQIVVDSTPYVSPQTFSWTIGSSHTISVSSPQSGGTGIQYVFSAWSDGGSSSHTITTPASTTTYTANFVTQYLLTTAVSPASSGSVNPDCSGGCWYSSGSLISLSPMPTGSNTFSSWAGDISSLNAPLLFTLNGPKNITASFNSVPVTGTVRIARTTPIYYDSIQSAYASAINNDVIQTQAISYGGALNFNRSDIPGLSVTLKGGYNATYSDNTGKSMLGSPLTIQSGTITLDNIVIQ